MDTQQVDLYLAANQKFFEPAQLPYIREQLLGLSEDKARMLPTLDLKDPIMMLVISLVVGGLGVDRFLLGDMKMGALKLITLGGCGIWSLIDLFLIMGMARQKNMDTLNQYLALR